MPKTKSSPAQPTTSQTKMPSTLTLRESDLPDIKDWQVGQTYHVMLEIKQTSADSGDGSPEVGGMSGNNMPHTARFTIVSAKSIGGKGGVSDTGSQNIKGKVMDTMAKKAKSYA